MSDDIILEKAATPAGKSITRKDANIIKIIEQSSVPISAPRRKMSRNEEINEKDLEVILKENDFLFYREKKEQYLDYYPDLTDPFDLDDLHLMIMEQIFQRNLLRKQSKSPAIDIRDDYERSIKRQLEFKKSLSVRRTDRVKNKQEGKKTINIAEMSVQFGDKDKMKEFTDRLKQLEDEEDNLPSPEARLD